MKRNHSNQSRTERNKPENKFDKIYYIVIAVLVLILLGLLTYVFVIRDNDTNQISENIAPSSELNTEIDQNETGETDQNANEENQSESDDPSQDENSEEDSQDQVENDETTDENDSESELNNVEEVDSEDPLVEKAYTGQWSPIGTEQSGDHITNFNDGSQDRIEINQAITSVTGLESNTIIDWWIAGDGPNQVEATVSNQSESEVYRIYLQFIEEEGWQPTRIEELSEVPSEYK